MGNEDDLIQKMFWADAEQSNFNIGADAAAPMAHALHPAGDSHRGHLEVREHLLPYFQATYWYPSAALLLSLFISIIL